MEGQRTATSHKTIHTCRDSGESEPNRERGKPVARLVILGHGKEPKGDAICSGKPFTPSDNEQNNRRPQTYPKGRRAAMLQTKPSVARSFRRKFWLGLPPSGGRLRQMHCVRNLLLAGGHKITKICITSKCTRTSGDTKP